MQMLHIKLNVVLPITNFLGLYISVVPELWIGRLASEKPGHSHHVTIPLHFQTAATFRYSCTSQRRYMILYLRKMASLFTVEEISVEYIPETLLPH
jgi:hypothetical protein